MGIRAANGSTCPSRSSTSWRRANRCERMTT